MTFTVVPGVRAVEATTWEASERLRPTLVHAMPVRGSAMDLPYAEHVIRLDFVSEDFATTVPGRLL